MRKCCVSIGFESSVSSSYALTGREGRDGALILMAAMVRFQSDLFL